MTEKSLAGFVDRVLSSNPLFEPLGPGSKDHALFEDYDLASLAETRLGQAVDPERFDPAAREHFQARALHPSELRDLTINDGTGRYWLRHGGRRVGCIAFMESFARRPGDCLYIFSLYVLPTHRRLGVARRALSVMHDAAYSADAAAVELETSWYGQPALWLYGGLGMWVKHWKHDFKMGWHRDLPPWRMEEDGGEARFIVGDRVVVSARRSACWLTWEEQEALAHLPRRLSSIEVVATFSLQLAMHGWPLLRTREHWDAQLALGFSDIGGPEGLAYRICRLRQWARAQRWTPHVPEIPGLRHVTEPPLR